ncbi:MAG: hypothetical protein GTO14_22140 [Anaerolineales bacterium]|nr:hypothetical protein [Anaerolineales bacterium]
MLISRLTPLLRTSIIILLVVLALGLPRWLLSRRYANRIHVVEEAPQRQVAIVLGAGLRRDGRPTTVLRDRVMTAVSLYQAGSVRQILMSGSVQPGRDEPAAMRSLALQLGIPDEDILLDREGNRTYDTCVRAKSYFGISSALVVTQRFHLPRALALCEANGVDVEGVSADLRFYRASFAWSLREIPATFRALWDVYTNKGKVQLSQPNTCASLHEEGNANGS